MASYFFLMNQFDDANFYLDSIKAYLEDDDGFNWNYGISLAASSKFEEVSSRAPSLGMHASPLNFTELIIVYFPIFAGVSSSA